MDSRYKWLTPTKIVQKSCITHNNSIVLAVDKAVSHYHLASIPYLTTNSPVLTLSSP